MKALLYSPSNFAVIAKETHTPIEEVAATYNEATRLQLKIYSVIDYIYFSTRVVNPNVKYVDAQIIKDYYKFDAPETVGKYSPVSLRYKKSRPEVFSQD